MLSVPPWPVLYTNQPTNQRATTGSVGNSCAGDDGSRGLLRNRLNPALTFDTLVEGTANRMARAAAMHVASMPGHLYNPLFIYGGVGLGKTHLVHAVGNKLLADQPDAKVLYIHAEQFVSDVVKMSTSARLLTNSRNATIRSICC